MIDCVDRILIDCFELLGRGEGEAGGGEDFVRPFCYRCSHVGLQSIVASQ